MFLNTTLRPYLDPFRFPGRLLIAVETEGRQECGVFSGRNGGFQDRELMEKRQPTVEDAEWNGNGVEVFEIAGLPLPGKDRVLQYNFYITSWKNAVYCSYPDSKEVVVHSHDNESWYFSYRDFSISLGPEYGALR